ncbi:response regulator [Mucilaginibacter ginkgonis]|uniref:Response regulator n=1 Tax=Mucilaginibacter ginkgonis TaxID=2682091 RepID=A0A6I4HVS0_9SPHI|nr:response regulator [Mucilaginibacter ginkgonis]QQL49955.1 response regulator [Mucilaginibacter ginkgonis]
MYKTCLLIDDNYVDNFVTRRTLESGNFAKEIVVKQSAKDAIAYLKSGLAMPEVIFLDLRMPDMNGFDFLREYDKLNIPEKKTIKIFMLSSSLDPNDVKKSSQNRYIKQFIYKPITHNILAELF